MEKWKHVVGLLTGLAALITATLPIISLIKESNQKYEFNHINDIKKNYAFVNDPDGWVNVRINPSTESKVLTKIKNGFRVEIITKSGNWYKVKTYNDQVGYIYFDRLKTNIL
jgi:uncharacterized protein YgiM (DUF1202 family)